MNSCFSTNRKLSRNAFWGLKRFFVDFVGGGDVRGGGLGQGSKKAPFKTGEFLHVDYEEGFAAFKSR
jgi:hypothetical protein